MQELREAAANIEPKHEKEIEDLMKSYRSSYSEWKFVLRCAIFCVWFTDQLLKF